jgi:probable DNA metabolism protein
MEHINDTLYYDGSFNGFLCLLYEVQARNLKPTSIFKRKESQEVLFLDSAYIPTHLKKARLLWNSMRSKNYGALKQLYFAFLSEEKNIEGKLVEFYRHITGSTTVDDQKTRLENTLHIEQMAAMVEREKWATERRLSLDPCGENLSICSIQPKYNILPLISKYFRTRYKDQEWVIYDSLRGYGLHHKNGTLTFNSAPPKQLEPFLTTMFCDPSRPNLFLKPDTAEQVSTKKRAQKSHRIQAVA